jgi:predicted glycosyltransferase
VNQRRVVGVVRPPLPAQTPAFGRGDRQAAALDELIARLAGHRNVTLVVIARSDPQRLHFAGGGQRNIIVTGDDAESSSIVAAADLLVAASAAMCREAAALGTPAYTLASGPLRAADTRLAAEGRLRRAATAADIQVRKKSHARTSAGVPHDPQLFVDEILAVAHRHRRRPSLLR